MFSFLTLQGPSKGSFKDKGSRFLAFAYPVDSDAAIRQHLDTLRREYFDARHHCYAWILGPEKKLFRAADDGEPSHSAGDPILGQIRSRDLTNVLIVVVRYFGGIKLGVGGLIAAYREAAADALRAATIIEKEVMVPITIIYPYDKTPEVMKLVKDCNIDIGHQEYGDECEMRASVALRHYEAMMTRIKAINIPQAVIQVRES